MVLAQSSTNGPRSLSFTKAGTHSALGERSHTAAHTPKHGRFGWGGITTLGAFHTFRKPCVARCQNGILCRFWVLVRCASEGHREPSGQRCAYARRCPEGVAAPLGCVIFSVSVEIAACMPCAQGLSVCARHGRYHYPRRALRAAETLDGRLSKRLTCRFLALPDSSLIPAAQNIVPFLYRCQKDQRDTRWSFHFCSHLLTCPDRPDRGT